MTDASPQEAEPPLGGLHPTLAYHVVNTLGWTTLRPLQRDALAPVLRGDDALLLAPTAGGKTEAATFPILTRMSAEGWTGLLDRAVGDLPVPVEGTAQQPASSP